MPNVSEDGFWSLIEDFDPQSSRAEFCSVSGMRKRADDVGVFRPVVNGMISFEGYFDVSQYAIEQAARLLGWKPPAEVELLRAKIDQLQAEVEGAFRAGAKKAADAAKMAGVRGPQ